MKKTLLIIFVILGLVTQAPVGAVEIKKDTSDSRSGQNIEGKPSPGGQDSASQPGSGGEVKVKSDQSKSAPRDFDSFIDKNNNGIDDRAEKKSGPEKPAEKPKK
jgi:hypothetical protein